MVIESTQRDGELEQQPSSSKLSLLIFVSLALTGEKITPDTLSWQAAMEENKKKMEHYSLLLNNMTKTLQVTDTELKVTIVIIYIIMRSIVFVEYVYMN